MTKSKKERWAEMKSFPNVLEPYDQPEEGEIKGKWHSDYFGNDHPIVVELGCGKGEYTLGLAEQHPEQNFIGIDIKGARMWKGAKRALENDLSNVAFLRIQIEHLLNYFAENEVDTIWITFPDPFPKKRHIKNRLSSTRFIESYQKILKKGGFVHLKTDATHFFEYTMGVAEGHPDIEIVKSLQDIYNVPRPLPFTNIITFYEKSHLEEGREIHYLCFRL